MESFEFKTKREFDGRDGLVRVGDRRDKDAKLGIAVGFMKLSRSDYFATISIDVLTN